jgi:hypothetical protein
MTTSDFYRDEAARCLRRADASRQPERARKWHELADEYLRLALLMEQAGSGREARVRAPAQQDRQPHQFR